MKEVHMLCNAHLDPVWLWQRQEGAAEAISTFRVAADFCEKYDGFVFNHNESLLYEWIEEYEPALFQRIQKLVQAGKWRIMGGWYLQPDCLMPSGESFIRQIETGNRYFFEKFGVKPTTAVNFDPFGHTRGLVQILKKWGYDSYLVVRPVNYVPEHDFIWEGYDGSQILGHFVLPNYSTNRGTVRYKIQAMMDDAHEGANLMCWGIGNHGGGPSREDLEYIEQYRKDNPDIPMYHSNCEAYFSKVDKSKLRTLKQSLVHVDVGCYTTMVQVKQSHRQLENELNLCEKMLAASGVKYDAGKLQDAEKALLFCEFHDILPGSCIRKGEQDALRLMSHGREITSQYQMKAFFKLCEGQKCAPEGQIPIMVFNPNPYWIETDVEAEFQLADQNWEKNQVTLVRVYNEAGEELFAQNEKEDCTFSLDWRKRVVFRAKLKPFSINRFNCTLHVEQGWKRPIETCEQDDEHFIIRTEKLEVRINKRTGLLDRYCVDGEDYLKPGSAQISAYKDNEDPWGMCVDSFCEHIGEFEMVSDEEANRFNGYPQEQLANVRVVENGVVRTKIQTIAKYKESYAVITYTIPKHDTYVDVHIKMLSNNVNTFYKLAFETTLDASRFIGQTAFGREEMLKEGKEVTYQKWCGLFQDDKALTVINNGTYGGSADGGTLNISLLRTPVYSAHPIEDRPIAEHDRAHDHIDMGEREFTYRLTTKTDMLDAQAEAYNQPLYTLSFFPGGSTEQDEKSHVSVELDNPTVVMTSFKKLNDGRYQMRLFNSAATNETVKVCFNEECITEQLTPYEIKTLLF